MNSCVVRFGLSLCGHLSVLAFSPVKQTGWPGGVRFDQCLQSAFITQSPFLALILQCLGAWKQTVQLQLGRIKSRKPRES